MLSVVIVYVLVVMPVLGAAAETGATGAMSQAGNTSKPTLKEQITEIAAGSTIEVRLKSKEKLRGRLGDITNEGFLIKTAHGNQIEEKKIGFDQVKSVKVSGRGWSTGAKIGVGILIGVGIVAVVLVIWVKATLNN